MNITVFGRRLTQMTSDVLGEAEGSGHASDVPQVCRPCASRAWSGLQAGCVWGGPWCRPHTAGCCSCWDPVLRGKLALRWGDRVLCGVLG